MPYDILSDGQPSALRPAVLFSNLSALQRDLSTFKHSRFMPVEIGECLCAHCACLHTLRYAHLTDWPNTSAFLEGRLKLLKTSPKTLAGVSSSTSSRVNVGTQ